MTAWQLQDAKARLGEVIQRAAAEGPQTITARGRPSAVLLSLEEYHRLRGPRPGFVDFMRSSPLAGTEPSFEGEQTQPRQATP
jgi:antitoxin Phd